MRDAADALLIDGVRLLAWLAELPKPAPARVVFKIGPVSEQRKA